MNERNLIKNDINFLEFPMWIVNDKGSAVEYKSQRNNGTYRIATSADRLPDRFDKIVLYYLLMKLSKMARKGIDKHELSTTRYEIVTNIFESGAPSKPKYDRVMASLIRWKNMTIEFKGSFFENDGYSERYFGVIDDVIHKPGQRELYIRINQQFLKQMMESEYYKLINFDEYKRLKKPVAARLYEVLSKTFKGRKVWKIDTSNLAEKLTLTKSYPSQVIEKIIPAMNEINASTDLRIEMQSNKNKDGETILTFRELSGSKVLPEESALPETIRCLELVPERQRSKSVMKLIQKFNGPDDVLASNIEFANRNAQRNYPGYLKQALEGDWGAQLREEREILCSRHKELIDESTGKLMESNGLSAAEAREKIVASLMDCLEKGIPEKYLSPDFLVDFLAKAQG